MKPSPLLLAFLALGLASSGCSRSETRVVVPPAAEGPVLGPAGESVTGAPGDTLIFDDDVASGEAPGPDGLAPGLAGEAPGTPGAPGTGAAAPAPEPFDTFLTRFKAAVRTRDREALARMVVFTDDFTRDAFDTYFEQVFGGPFAARMLALTPRDFERDGEARAITVRAGFDADGNPVPEDEAISESTARLRFERDAEGRFRLVRLDAQAS